MASQIRAFCDERKWLVICFPVTARWAMMAQGRRDESRRGTKREGEKLVDDDEWLARGSCRHGWTAPMARQKKGGRESDNHDGAQRRSRCRNHSPTAFLWRVVDRIYRTVGALWLLVRLLLPATPGCDDGCLVVRKEVQTLLAPSLCTVQPSDNAPVWFSFFLTSFSENLAVERIWL
jgi:hypothetical protein